MGPKRTTRGSPSLMAIPSPSRSRSCSAPPPPPPANLILIDPEGDIHISCGDSYIIVESGDEEDNGKLPTFQASSKPLTLASPVFKKILDPTSNFAQFTNDQGFRTVRTFASPELLSTVLNILHYQTQDVPKQTPDVIFMEELALFADEYEMSGALAMQVEKWCHGSEIWKKFDGKLVGDLGTWLLVAWVFKIDWFYEHITKHIILEAVWVQEQDDQNDGTGGTDENSLNKEEDWFMMVATNEDSHKPMSRLGVHDRLPKLVLDQLRDASASHQANLEKITHPYVLERFLLHHNYSDAQHRIDIPSMKLDRSNLCWEHAYFDAMLQDRFNSMIDIHPYIPENGAGGEHNEAKSMEERYTESRMNCSLQRFFDAAELFQLDYAAIHHSNKEMKGFFNPVEKEKAAIKGFQLL